MKKITLLLTTLTFCLSLNLFAQSGYSSASMGMSQQKCDHAVIPVPDEIVLEEYINYHRHRIELPRKGKSVALDVRWGNDQVAPTAPEAVLQVGIATSRIMDYREVIPLNVSLVIDKSGSMADDRKLEKTKEAMMAFVKRLRPQDFISIVEFDHAANVVLQAQPAANMTIIESAIQSIRLGGSTNLHDGIINGYQEILKNYDNAFTNRVIVLTDALTNTGIVDPEEIIKNSSTYNKENQIDFAMIGVGVDFNHTLSRQLTSNGKNQIHFINDVNDIKKVFIDEVEALISPIAKNPILEIDFGHQLELVQLYGYHPSYGQQKMTFNLNNMNAGLTQVVLAKFKAKGAADGALRVKVKLSYYDILKKKQETIEETIRLQTVSGWEETAIDMLAEPEVKRNYAIADMAFCLKEMADAFAANKTCVARRTLTETATQVRIDFAQEMDPDIQFMLDILETYLERLTAIAGND